MKVVLASFLATCEVHDVGIWDGLGSKTHCDIWCIVVCYWKRLDREARWMLQEDKRQRRKGVSLMPASRTATHMEVGHSIWVPDSASMAPLLDHCVWCFSLQGLCFPIMNAVSLRDGLIRIKTGYKTVDMQYLEGFIALCFHVLLLWIQLALAAQETALANS